MDGPTISVPLAGYHRLMFATLELGNNRKICGGGFGTHWPDLDEDLSTEGLLREAPAPRQTISSVALENSAKSGFTKAMAAAVAYCLVLNVADSIRGHTLLTPIHVIEIILPVIIGSG